MFLRLSGVSTDLLKHTGSFQQKEQIKYSRYGKLIIIPAVLGGFAGGHALSTIFDDFYWCLAWGVFWFFAVLFIDMAMSATLYKTTKDKKIGFWIQVTFRLLFSIVVGAVIADPLVLRLFEPNILQSIKERDFEKKTEKILAAKSTLTTAKQPFQQKIDALQAQNACLGRLIQFEESSANVNGNVKEFFTNEDKPLSCGFSSGKGAGCFGECINRKGIITKNNKEILDLQKELSENSKTEKILLKEVEDRKNIEPSLDYLSRTEEMEVLKYGDGNTRKPHPDIATKHTFLIWFFIVIDCLIVGFKAFTPMGAYEHTIELMLDRHIAALKSENSAHEIYVNSVSQAKAKINADTEKLKTEALGLQALIVQTFSDSERNNEEIRNLIRKQTRGSLFMSKEEKTRLKKMAFEMENLQATAHAKTIEKLGKIIEEA